MTKVVEPKKTTKSVETQTDVTWPYKSKQFKLMNPSQLNSSNTTTSSLSTQTQDQTLSVSKDAASPGKASHKERVKAHSNRQSKGSDDPVQLHNRFGGLDEMDTTEVSKGQKSRPEPAPRPGPAPRPVPPPNKPTLSRLPTNK